MVFIRFVGCSVGKRICQHCDTDFEKALPWMGGGEFTPGGLVERVHDKGVGHVCLTGGEPFDQDLEPLLRMLKGYRVHIETSGTVVPSCTISTSKRDGYRVVGDRHQWVWITCSPKPGWKQEVVDLADEVKVIVGGLGNGEGWPSLEDALNFAIYKPTFLQPRNLKHEVNSLNLKHAEDLVLRNPTLRLSAQVHKFLQVR